MLGSRSSASRSNSNATTIARLMSAMRRVRPDSTPSQPNACSPALTYRQPCASAQAGLDASLFCRSGLAQAPLDQWIAMLARADREARTQDAYVAGSITARLMAYRTSVNSR